ncbi:MAG: hypothetical protein IPK91_02660 [Saprospiraceae bacterium]|nr:hypothetical protein [Saprospiraceae bacterium]MBK8296191.1 hypothetical protein [Saprospiraceae bacterium]
MSKKSSSIGRRRKKTTTRRRKATVGKKSLGATLKAFGRTYTKKSCSRTKAAATKSANASKRAGKSAMVKKNPAGGYCTFVRSKKAA